MSAEDKAAWHIRYCAQEGAEPRVWVLLERVEQELRAADEAVYHSFAVGDVGGSGWTGRRTRRARIRGAGGDGLRVAGGLGSWPAQEIVGELAVEVLRSLGEPVAAVPADPGL